MSGTILLGYDIEAGSIGENLAHLGGDIEPYRLCLDPKTATRGLEIIQDIHESLQVPGTLFTCGKTMTHHKDALVAAKTSGLFDIQSHTYSHILFKDQAWQDDVFKASPPAAIDFELRVTSEIVAECFGAECIGLRTPFCYNQGLRGRPDLLQLLHNNGIKYVSSWGRNEQGGNPTPWVQPFRYREEGFPDIVELPLQYWLDVLWFEVNGFDAGSRFKDVLCQAVDQIVEDDLVYGVCFHDWPMIACDEIGTGWARGFIQYAIDSGVEVTSYTSYYNGM